MKDPDVLLNNMHWFRRILAEIDVFFGIKSKSALFQVPQASCNIPVEDLKIKIDAHIVPG